MVKLQELDPSQEALEGDISALNLMTEDESDDDDDGTLEPVNYDEPATVSNQGEKETLKAERKRKNHRSGQKHKKAAGRSVAVSRSEENALDGSRHTSSNKADMVSSDTLAESPAGPKLYKVKAVAGNGLGVFAAHDIKRGTRIMAEEPLMRIEQSGNDLHSILNAFAKLSSAEQATYLSLYSRANETVDELRQGALGERQDVKNDTHVLAIFETNAFEAFPGSAVCREASRINHSCVPNVNHSWSKAIGRQVVHAIRDIEAGEEIQTSYIEFCLDKSQRQKQLEWYAFKCRCAACDTSTPFGKASDRRRKRMYRIEKDLATYESPSAGMGPLQSKKQVLKVLLEMMKLLRQEGLENMKMARVYREAASCSASLGNYDKACHWQKQVVEEIGLYVGVDFDAYEVEEKVLKEYEVARLRDEAKH